MPKRHIAFQNPEEALTKYFEHFFYKLKVGLVSTIVGSTFLKTGTGKSYTALRLAELIDEDFNLEKVVYYPREFLSVMDKVEENGKPAQVVVVDEGEITAPANLWYSWTNKAIAYNLATFRYLRCMAIFVSPAFSWLDKKVRILTSHIGFSEKYWEDLAGREKKSIVKLRLYRIKTDLFGEKIFFEKIKMFDNSANRMVSFRDFKVNMPSEDLIEAYEKKSREFKQGIRKSLIKEIEKFEKYESGKAEEKKDIRNLVDIALQKPLIRKELEEKGKVAGAVIKYDMAEYNLTNVEAGMLAKIIKTVWSGKK
jgi:hypothetical protein